MTAAVSSASDDASTIALAFRGVTVAPTDGRRTQPLLDALDWTVGRGEHWAVLGANGAGKTTLLRVAAGELAPDAGSVTVLGERHGAVGLRDPRLRIGLIGGPARTFAGQMTAVDVIVLKDSGPPAMIGGRVSDEERRRARDLLALFECGALADRRYADCSQGERQRILLARALLRDPELLLFDEPITGLDLPARESLLQAMDELAAKRAGLATVTVTHHVEELPGSTTHVLLLRDGRSVAAGPAEATLTEPLLSDCFGVPIRIARFGARWVARAGTRSAQAP